MVVAGSTDLQVTVEDAQRLQIANAKAELKVIEGMNHVLKNSSALTNENTASYSNPNLPLNEEFEKSINTFFSKHLRLMTVLKSEPKDQSDIELKAKSWRCASKPKQTVN